MSSIANYDAQAGIHYGFIYCNDVGGDAFCEIQDNGTDLGWEEAQSEAKKAVSALTEELREAIRDYNERVDSLIASHLEGWDVPTARDNLEVESPTFLDGEEAWDALEQQFSDETQEMESGPYRYEQDGYILDTTSDNGLFVIKSPFYTTCRECSPCAPNAGYLKSQPGSLKTYCLGADWFDEFSPLPYTVYSVETGEVVTEGPKEEE